MAEKQKDPSLLEVLSYLSPVLQGAQAPNRPIGNTGGVRADFQLAKDGTVSEVKKEGPWRNWIDQALGLSPLLSAPETLSKIGEKKAPISGTVPGGPYNQEKQGTLAQGLESFGQSMMNPENPWAVTNPDSVMNPGYGPRKAMEWWGGASDAPPPEPPTPLSPFSNPQTEMLLQMLGGGAPGGAAGQSQSTTAGPVGPFDMSMSLPRTTVENSQLPMPDFDPVRQGLENAAPQPGQAPGMAPFILQALSQAQQTPGNMGSTLLNLGLASLGGVGQGMAANTQFDNEQQEAMRQHELLKTQVEQELIQSALGQQNAQAQMGQADRHLQARLDAQRNAQAGIQGVSGGLLATEVGPDGLRAQFRPTVKPGTSTGSTSRQDGMASPAAMAMLKAQGQPINMGKSLMEGNLPANIAPEAAARLSGTIQSIMAGETYQEQVAQGLPPEMVLEQGLLNLDPDLYSYMRQALADQNIYKGF